MMINSSKILTFEMARHKIGPIIDTLHVLTWLTHVDHTLVMPHCDTEDTERRETYYCAKPYPHRCRDSTYTPFLESQIEIRIYILNSVQCLYEHTRLNLWDRVVCPNFGHPTLTSSF